MKILISEPLTFIPFFFLFLSPRFQVSALPVARKAAGLIENETEILYEGKLQTTSTKLQINLKFQYSITETHVRFACEEGYFDSGLTIEKRFFDLKLQ